jgi:hypothetical protein
MVVEKPSSRLALRGKQACYKIVIVHINLSKLACLALPASKKVGGRKKLKLLLYGL